jgi:hypothetical protein
VSERSERAGPTDSGVTVQYRVVAGKKDERVEGPDDAALVVTIPLDDARDEDFDATVAYMRGRLKSTGSTGALFELLRSGAAADAIRRLASQP